MHADRRCVVRKVDKVVGSGCLPATKLDPVYKVFIRRRLSHVCWLKLGLAQRHGCVLLELARMARATRANKV